MTAIEQQPRIHEGQPCGGILAHEMGLGKTVTMLTHMALQPGLNLVICPKSVLMHWHKEAVGRALYQEDQLFLYYGVNRKQAWDSHTQLVLTTFDIVRMESGMKKTSLLFTTTWTRIVLDEAHRICERSSKTSKGIAQLKGCNRWCLTGTPYKNGLSDIVALCKFLKIQPYCKATWWKHNAHNDLSLHLWRSAFVHMRHKSTSFLPPLKIRNRSVPSSDAEAQVQGIVRAIQLESDNKNKVQEFELLKILRMRQSAVHPFLFLSDEARTHLLHQSPCIDEGRCSACSSDQVATLAPITVEIESQGTTLTVEEHDEETLLNHLPQTPAPVKQTSHPWNLHFDKGTTTLTCSLHTLCNKCRFNTLVCPTCMALTLPRSSHEQWLHSTKTRELLHILKKAVGLGNKVIVFSQWTTCLDLVQSMLQHYNLAFCRFDGTVTTLEERGSIVEQFGKSTDTFIMLTSLGAGGEGIDLTCANTVVLLEPYWNSAIEQQAIDRVHRLGQKHVTKVYKLTLQNSVEDWVLDLQQLKQQEQHYYLQGTAPKAQPSLPANTSLGKRHQRLLDKVSGTSVMTNGNWKKTGPRSTLAPTSAAKLDPLLLEPKILKPAESMLTQFIF